MAETSKSLQHVGIIMDGNRRWAKARGVRSADGHRAGFEALFALIPTVKELNISYLTVYVFSTENWQRSRDEVGALMSLLLWVVKHKLKAFKKEEFRIRIVGSRENVPENVLAALDFAEAETAHLTKGTLAVCFNYGGQQEILDATRKLIADGVDAETLTAERFSQAVYAPEIPQMDLLIRPGGEQRISNFMLWRAGYAELYFTDVLWPDFSPDELRKAAQVYGERQRRFGH